MTKDSKVVTRGKLFGILCLLTNISNNAMNLVPIGGNVVVGHQKFEQEKKDGAL